MNKIYTPILFVFLAGFAGTATFAQDNQSRLLTLDEAVNMALSNHPASKNAALKVEASKTRQKEFFSIPNTNFAWEYGQINSPVNDNKISVIQNFGSPATHIQRKRLLEEEFNLSETSQKLTQKQLILSVKSAYFKWVHQISMTNLNEEEIEVFQDFIDIANVQNEGKEGDSLEKTLIEIKFAEVQRKLLLSQEQIKIAVNNLNRFIYSEEPYQPSLKELDLYTINFSEKQEDKFYPFTFKQYFEQQVKQKNTELNLEKSYLYPEIYAGYFHQSIQPLKNLQGFQLGISLPLWFMPQASKVKVAKINKDIASNEATLRTYELEQTIDDLKIKLDQEFITVIYFREKALAQADTLLKTATHKVANEEISYKDYLYMLAQVIGIKEDYLNSILAYNLTALELEYLLN